MRKFIQSLICLILILALVIPFIVGMSNPSEHDCSVCCENIPIGDVSVFDWEDYREGLFKQTYTLRIFPELESEIRTIVLQELFLDGIIPSYVFMLNRRCL